MHSVDDLSEDNMLAIKMRCINEAKEELTSVGISAGVGHGKTAGKMLDFEVLVGEDSAVNRFSSGSISSSEISALKHESRNNPMEVAPFVVERDSAPTLALFPGAELSEVLSCLGNGFPEKAENDFALVFSVDFDGESDL